MPVTPRERATSSLRRADGLRDEHADAVAERQRQHVHHRSHVGDDLVRRQCTAPSRATKSAMNVNAVTSMKNVGPIGTPECHEVAKIAQARPRPAREYAVARVTRRLRAPRPRGDADEPVDDGRGERASGGAELRCAARPKTNAKVSGTWSARPGEFIPSSRAAAKARWCSSRTSGCESRQCAPPRRRGRPAPALDLGRRAAPARSAKSGSGYAKTTMDRAASPVASHMPWRTCSPISSWRPAPAIARRWGERDQHAHECDEDAEVDRRRCPRAARSSVE